MAEKAISVCADEADRITSLCYDDLTGNTGWTRTTVETLGLDMDAALNDEHGACLYKLVDGCVVERTIEERMKDWPPEPDPVQTPEEKIAELELALRTLLGDDIY